MADGYMAASARVLATESSGTLVHSTRTRPNTPETDMTAESEVYTLGRQCDETVGLKLQTTGQRGWLLTGREPDR